MKKNIKQILDTIVLDNKQYILNDQTAADYLLTEVENNPSTPYDFFEESELGKNNEPSEEALKELKEYISDNYKYFMANYDWSSDTFEEEDIRFLVEGEHLQEAYDAMELNPFEEGGEEWAEICIRASDRKRIAVYGNISITGHGVFLYKELD